MSHTLLSNWTIFVMFTIIIIGDWIMDTRITSALAALTSAVSDATNVANTLKGQALSETDIKTISDSINSAATTLSALKDLITPATVTVVDSPPAPTQAAPAPPSSL